MLSVRRVKTVDRSACSLLAGRHETPHLREPTGGHVTIVHTVLLSVFAVSLHAQAPTVRDSAGIRIVMNPSFAAAPETFRFNPSPILDVGGLDDDPDLEFKSNQGYLRGVFLSNGTLAVTDEWRLQFFDRQGKRLGILGTRGAGPEDFRYIMGICRTRGDTLLVYDSRNARNVVISPARTVVRTWPGGTNGSLTFSSCFEDGTVVLSHSEYDRATQMLTMQYRRARLDGTILNALLSASPTPLDMVTMAEHAVATGGQRFYHGLPGASQVTAYDVTGRPVLVVRYSATPERIMDADALRRMSYAIPGGRKPTEAEIAASKAEGLRRWKSGPHAEYWPTHDRIHVDDQGRLWVNQYRKNMDVLDVWVAFAADGRMLGKLILPVGRREVIGFQNDAILIRTFDDDGATHLALHSIRR